MKALVTGATGFTGAHLAKRLYASGTEVRVLVRDRRKVNTTADYRPEIIQGDIRDLEAVENAVKGVDRIFHVAAMFRTAGIADSVYWDVHVSGTEHLLKAALKHGVKRFVHCSTVGVHGHVEAPPADETYRFKPNDIYQKTKLAGELKALAFHKETGLPVAVIRPCAIYGPGDMRLYKLFKLAAAPVVPLLGDGQMIYHMVHVDDLVNGFLLAGEKEAAVGESFIIGGAERKRLNEIMEMILEIQGKTAKIIHLPAAPFQLIGDICERICIPFGIEPPIYRRRVDFFTKTRAFDISKAKNLLGYVPRIPLKEGLRQTTQWYKQKGVLQ